MTIFRKIALGSASAALLATSAAPTIASANDYRGRGGWGRHDRGIDAGDVIAGIGILAGIAIIASAASASNKRLRGRDNYPQESRYPAPDSSPRNADYDSSNDLSAAVDKCTRAAEQRAGDNARVEEIRSVTRQGNGWRVEGNLSGALASSFSCGTNGGQVDFVQMNS